MPQLVENNCTLPEFLAAVQAARPFKRLLIVCGKNSAQLEAAKAVKSLDGIAQVWFDDFQANPDYSSVVSGVQTFSREECDAILAIGGGSALDVAKCIKLYYGLNPEKTMLEQEPVPNDIPLIAMPTTAGTGSEATRYAVIYYLGEKQSITSDCIIPEYVFMDASALKSLPRYQKCSTAMDALCHAIESMWSINSTVESQAYSKQAIHLILENLNAYISGDQNAAQKMLIASNFAGKAINITQTTAGHAMCYKITSLFRFSHGHAAALCVSVLWPYMLQCSEQTIDPRGSEYLDKMFMELAECFGTQTPEQAADRFREIVEALDLRPNRRLQDLELQILAGSVNPVRLKNNPIPLEKETLRVLYKCIFQ